MMRYILLSLLCLVLTLWATASPPQRAGPTSSGYSFLVRISEIDIWAVYPELADDDDYPLSAELIVEVQNAQGQPANGVVVEFQVSPAWTGNTAIFPPRVVTSGGAARALLQTMSLDPVRFVVRVDGTTQEAEIEAISHGTLPGGYH